MQTNLQKFTNRKDEINHLIPASVTSPGSLTSLPAHLQQAWEQDEFEVYYEPQINIRSGEIVGFEALLRWQHPEKGLLSPSTFIDVLEQSNLIIAIGEWVLETACKQAMIWHEQGFYTISMSVNICEKQLVQADFTERVAIILDKTGLAHSYLKLELIERTLFADIPQVAQTLKSLHQMGVEIAIDDFGMGYGCFNYLRKFPISYLKIDPVLSHNIAHEKVDRIIVSAIAAMTKNLGIKIIVEGIESKEQIACLRRMNCDEAQGYLFSRALPAQDIEKLINRNFISAERINLKNQLKLWLNNLMQIVHIFAPTFSR